MRLLQFHLSATSASDSHSTFGHEHGAAVISLLKEAMLVAHAQVKRSAGHGIVKSSQQLIVTIPYDQLSGFTELLLLCLKKWINQLAGADDVVVRGRFYYVQEARLMLTVLSLW
jgi:hypothetical protein